MIGMRSEHVDMVRPAAQEDSEYRLWVAADVAYNICISAHTQDSYGSVIHFSATEVQPIHSTNRPVLGSGSNRSRIQLRTRPTRF